MRLRKFDSFTGANQYLEEEFLDELNARFHVEARSPANLHRSVPRGLRLEHVLCFQDQRVVQNDWTVSWCNRIFQIHEKHQKLSLAEKKILVSELLDGQIRLAHQGRTLVCKELPERPLEVGPKQIPKVATHPYQTSRDSSLAKQVPEMRHFRRVVELASLRFASAHLREANPTTPGGNVTFLKRQPL